MHVENTERSERYPPKTHLAGGGGTLVLVPAPQRQGGAPQHEADGPRYVCKYTYTYTGTRLVQDLYSDLDLAGSGKKKSLKYIDS